MLEKFSGVIKYGKPLDMRSIKRGIEWRREIAADQKILALGLSGDRDQLDTCPICKHPKTSAYVSIFGYPYHTCNSCGHVFCATPPRNDAVANLYNEGSPAGSKSVQSKIYLNDELFNRRVNAIAQPKIDFLTTVLAHKQVFSREKWIDIGSGAGEILLAASNAGWNTLGIESDKQECLFARAKGLTVINEYLSGDAFENFLGGAQIVSLFNVLEHIREPKEFLAAIARAIKTGFLIFEIPRHPSISSLSAELFPEMACRHIYPPDHLHIFTDRSGLELLAGTGFEIVGKWFFGQDFFDLISSAGANQGIGMNTVWENIADASPKIQQVVDEAGLADTMILVAHKGCV